MNDDLYRYIDSKFDDQNRFIVTLMAPVLSDVVGLKQGMYGDGNGLKSLREMIRTHVHEGMVRVNRKFLVSVAAIAGSVASVVAAAFSILK